MPQNLSKEELLQAYLDLQARVTRFSSKEQELINIRDQLDQELEVYKRMNDFHAEALEADSVPALLALIAEYVVDLFECEMGYACVSDVVSESLVAEYLEGGQRALAEDHRAAFRAMCTVAGGAAVESASESAVAGGRAAAESAEPPQAAPDSSGSLAWYQVAERRPPSSTRNLTVIAGASTGRGGTFAPFSPKKSVLFQLFVESCAPYVGTIESTARIQQQLETIRKSELEQRRLSLIATTTHSGVIITDARGYIEWVNDAFTTNTGYDFDEVLGRKPKDFLQAPGLNDGDTLRRLSESLAVPENVSVDLKNLRKSGEPFYIRLDITPVFDRENRLINYIGIQQDITDGKVSQERLEAQNEELTKINQELDQFVYSISHDLRAPLLSIKGLLDLVELDNGGQSNGVEQGNGVYLKMISESVTRLDHTILEILNYSRNARLDVHPVEFNFRTFVADLVADLGNLRPEVAIDVQWKGSEMVRLDEVRAGVLFKNILSNALKYSKQDVDDANVIVDVHVEPDQCSVRVADNGLGIAEEHLQKVFDMFYRATQRGAGTGLGLYICKEIVDKLNGTLSLESTLGEGTTVTFTLPQ